GFLKRQVAQAWSGTAAAMAGPAASVLLALCLGLVSAVPVRAGGVPLPRERPELATPSPPGDPAASATPATAADTANPFLVKKPRGPSRFTPEQQQVLGEVSQSLNSFRTMEGQFIQFGPHGEQSEGVFYISRPGKIRFHYRPPVKLDVISDGHNVAVRDNRAMT